MAEVPAGLLGVEVARGLVLGEFYLYDTNVEDVDKVFVLVDVVVDQVDIEVTRQAVFGQDLQGKEMLKDHTTRLEQDVREPFFPICWL